jgi:general nucleoside transport system permease protein
MRIELEKRPKASKLFGFVSPLLALILTLIAGLIMFSALGKDPLEALDVLFLEPLYDVWSLHELAQKATPLILIAAGLLICYRSNNWNIGAEGQYTIGAIFGSAIPILTDWHSPLMLPAMLILGALGGALYAGIPALLKAHFNTNEILTSLMLVYIAQLFLDWLIRGAWRNPEGHNFPVSVDFPPEAVLPPIWPDSGSTHWGFVFAIAAAVIIWFMMRYTLKGFEVVVLGQSERAGRFAGFSSRRMVWFSFLLSGALAGLAGISVVSGSIGHLQPVVSPGYGFTAIIVAFLGRLNPLGIIASGLVLALTYVGGEAAQLSIGVSDKVTHAFQGLLLFFVLSCDTFIHYKVRIVRPHARVALTEAVQ